MSPVDNGDGTFGVKVDESVAEVGGEKYLSLQEAVDAAKSGATVKLLKDTKENVTISKKLTLDLNGKTLNGGQVKGTPALKVDNASVTIQDSSAAQNGTIMRGGYRGELWRFLSLCHRRSGRIRLPEN